MPGDTSDQTPILAIVGPTATGKTDVAVAVATELGGEIISADSMAVYRGMDIGTAKPTVEQRAAVPCHLIDVLEPTEVFSAAEFTRLASAIIEDCRLRRRAALVVGGTGFYVRALLDGLGLGGTAAHPGIRARLASEAQALGSAALHTRLARIDPVAATRIHPNDAVRIVRALELWEVTGRTPTELAVTDSEHRRGRPAVRVGLRMDMRQLDERIHARVDAMFAKGLIDEVAGILARGVPDDAPGMRALGYREVVAYLRGAISLTTCVDMVKKRTRRYARRQMTWFRADRSVHWLDVSDITASEVASAILALYEAHTRR